MYSPKSDQRGGIVPEALLALVIFILVSQALFNVITQAANQQHILQNTRCANWLADDLFVQEFLSPATHKMGSSLGESWQCDVLWHWRINRQASDDSRFYLIILEIHNGENRLHVKRQTLRAW
jgi:hypothetical protein